MEIRAEKGKQIAQIERAVTRLDDHTYKVASQSSRTIYEILSTENGWVCQCPDHMYRAVKCKHIWAVEFSFAIRRLVAKEVVIASLNTQACIFCGSNQIIKKSVRHNKAGDLQRYFCKSCGKRFSFNLGFKGMRATPQVITSAMQLYFSGESLRNTQRFLALQGVRISYVAVYKWIKKYVSLMQKYVDRIQPKVGNAWRTDELFVKIRGNMRYLFS
ncbi:MAG: transposase, partial [Nitrososphaerales archaeon]